MYLYLGLNFQNFGVVTSIPVSVSVSMPLTRHIDGTWIKYFGNGTDDHEIIFFFLKITVGSMLFICLL